MNNYSRLRRESIHRPLYVFPKGNWLRSSSPKTQSAAKSGKDKLITDFEKTPKKTTMMQTETINSYYATAVVSAYAFITHVRELLNPANTQSTAVLFVKVPQSSVMRET